MFLLTFVPCFSSNLCVFINGLRLDLDSLNFSIFLFYFFQNFVINFYMIYLLRLDPNFLLIYLI